MTKRTGNKRMVELDEASKKVTRWIGSISSLIVHTAIFILCFIFVLLGAPLDRVLLILTTIVSLEAIYLGIFIQMTVNKNTADIDEIQEDVEDIAEDVDEIQKDIDEIQEDVDEIQEDVDEIADDTEEPVAGEILHHKESHPEILSKIQHVLESLAKDVEALKNKER
ncbi:MAG: hypothetical protein RL641_269 [Candidatus Parcubacteria bacterium]|jgi:uncharacterized protein YoxC